jgi:5-methylcytosine-specific restriction enzyme A
LISPCKIKNGSAEPWSRDELILALDLYAHHRDKLPDHDSPEIIELSAILNKLSGSAGGEFDKFRNTNGVYMKLANFRALDPEHTAQGKQGLTRGGQGDRDVWAEYSGRLADLHAAAAAIKAASDAKEDIDSAQDDAFVDAAEGRLLSRMHVARERSRDLVVRKKAAVLKSRGKLVCEACDFDFATTYGPRGNGFIECHHVQPLHTLRPGVRTRLSDLALVCSNCHRMIHARSPWLSMDELRTMIAENHGRHTHS